MLINTLITDLSVRKIFSISLLGEIYVMSHVEFFTSVLYTKTALGAVTDTCE